MLHYYAVEGSSNGRTAVSGTVSRGSSPCPSANVKAPSLLGAFVCVTPHPRPGRVPHCSHSMWNTCAMFTEGESASSDPFHGCIPCNRFPRGNVLSRWIRVPLMVYTLGQTGELV